MEKFHFQSASELDSFIASIPGSSLLQSFTWGEIAQAEGNLVERIGVREGNKILAGVTLIKKKIAFGKYYWFSPRGPLFSNSSDIKVQEELFKAVKELDQSVIFWRFEPQQKQLFNNHQIFKTVDLNPSKTLILDLNHSEEELLQHMHQKTRYNIRLADKKGVTVKEVSSPSEKDWQEFKQLLKLTGTRDGFRLHEFKHYRNLVEFGAGHIKMYTAYHSGQAIASGLFSVWSGQATYLHGASNSSFRQLMAPYLLQWTVITAAKQAGARTYDFYGIDEEKWPGVTRFKMGFSGDIVSYPGTFDVVFCPVIYKLYSSLRFLRRQLGKLYARNK